MKLKLNSNTFFVSLFFLCLSYACANKGPGPTGGPKDETPPKVMKTTPAFGATNFQKKEIVVEFDENIQLNKISENVIISPPQKKNPEILGRGKRVRVKFEENLIDNTTYTINFGNAIVDNNERNELKNFRFSFSTGDAIDTLGVSGYLLNAENLSPMRGILVGIHPADEDSAFIQKPFLRIGKTNEEGYFTIDNMKEGSYRIFALEDANRDYSFQTGEGLAFYDSLISPSIALREWQDTIWLASDTTKIDTIISSVETRLLPDSIMLKFFKEKRIRQYLIKSARPIEEKFTLFFNTTLAEPPVIEPLNFEWEGKHITQTNNTSDTLNYWLLDSLLWKTDTLKMTVSYLKTDSIFQLIPTVDTLNISMRKTRTRAKEKEKKEPTLPALNIKNNIISKFDFHKEILLEFDEPLQKHDFSQVVISQKKDTLFYPLEYNWHLHDSTKMIFSLQHKWEPTASYELKIDSAAFISVFDKANNALKKDFTIRSLEEYSDIEIILANYDSLAVIQLLDAKENPVATKAAKKEGTSFKHLEPKDYYLRLFIDRNGNGKWDTGDFEKRIQPEEVFYFPTKLTLKANFEFSETWDHTENHLLKQKPNELKKEDKK